MPFIRISIIHLLEMLSTSTEQEKYISINQSLPDTILSESIVLYFSCPFVTCLIEILINIFCVKVRKCCLLSPNFQTLELRHKFDLIMDKDIYSTLADSRPLIALIYNYLLKIQFTTTNKEDKIQQQTANHSTTRQLKTVLSITTLQTCCLNLVLVLVT